MKTLAQLQTKPGTGKGVGEPERKAGGTDICRCPSCGFEISHSRGNPCNEIKCKKCGKEMVGK